jgi:hypothetical protein
MSWLPTPPSFSTRQCRQSLCHGGEHISSLCDWGFSQKDLEGIPYSGCCHGFYIAVLSVLQHVQKLQRHMTGCWTPRSCMERNCGTVWPATCSPIQVRGLAHAYQLGSAVFGLDFLVSSVIIFLLGWVVGMFHSFGFCLKKTESREGVTALTPLGLTLAFDRILAELGSRDVHCLWLLRTKAKLKLSWAVGMSPVFHFRAKVLSWSCKHVYCLILAITA